MEQAARFEASAAARKFAPVANPPLRAVSNLRLYREVFGFAFASSLGDPNIGYPSWNFSLLSTVAYFGIHVDWTGDFSGGSALNMWNDPNGPVPGFIQTAHANGTKVVLTIAMFDSTSGTPNMCSALQRSNVTIQRTVLEINAKAIDGVNVDYESNNTTCTDPGTGAVQSSQSLFTNFVAQLRAALPAGRNYLSVDTYSGAAGYRNSTGAYLGFFDIGALNNYADSFFIMAYDMEYANWDSPPLSCPSFCIGPTAPLSTYLFNDNRASAEYRAVVPASKIIMGIPYYGRKECVAVPDPNQIPPNAVGSSVGADGYLDASTENGYPGNTQYVSHRETRDPLSATRWDTFSSVSAGCNRELYWDDATALGNKYNLVINDHLRGAGIFALNYGGGAPELWSLINLKFGQCSEAAVSADHSSPQIPATSINFNASALCAGIGTFRFSLQPPGGAFSVTQPYSTSSTWAWDTTGKPLGTYTVQVEAENQGATPAAGYDTRAQMAFRLALCVTPAISSDLSSPRLPSTAVAFTATVTCQGTPEYRFWVLPPGGIWTIAQDYGSAATFKWDTSHLAYGDYAISVHVRTSGTTVPYESFTSMPYSLRSCISTALTTDKASPQPTGTHVVLSGAATCDGPAQYRFMIQPPGGSSSVVQDFSSSAGYTWLGGGAGGAYNVEVDAKSTAAPVSSMVSSQMVYTLTSCSAVTLATSLAAPQVPGPTVTLTGSATCPATAQYRFTIRKPDGSGGIVQDYGAASTYAWNTNGQALGNYHLQVDTKNAGATTDSEATASTTYLLALPTCINTTLAPDLASPQGTGAVVTFSATTTTCPHPLYQFWILPPGGSWTIMQSYSSNTTFRWDTAGRAAGSYSVSVWTRETTGQGAHTSSLGSYDDFASATDVLTSMPCASVTSSTAPGLTAVAGSPVTVTGSATCAHPNPLYEFWILAPGSTSWKLAQAYSSSASFTWNTTPPAGAYQLSVWVRDVSSSGTNRSGLGNYDAFAPGTTYTLTSQACASVTASVAPATSSAAGAPVAITGSAAGCPNPRYEFWILPPGGSWAIAQAYSASATFNWNTAVPAGTYRYSVWVRDASMLSAYDAFVPGSDYTLTTTACTGVTASAAPASPQSAGTPVTITAGASGCPNPRYEFWILPPGGGWTIAQAYSSSATFSWNTAPPSGPYRYSVWARDAGSPAAYEAFVPGATYALTTTPCTGVTASAAPASPQSVGTTITINATASGCTNPRYEFWILAAGGAWTVVQAYSSNATFSWITSGLPPGIYRYSVWVRDASSSAPYDTYAPGTAYTLT